MKSPFYSFELENYKFIVLNTCFYSNDGVEEVFYENNYKVKGCVYPVLPQEHLNWLREELDDHEKHIVFHIIVFQMNLQNGEFRIGILYRICFLPGMYFCV